jgi:hypothetical protein
VECADALFRVGGGVGENGTRTIQENWKYVDIQWLVKIKTDSDGNVHYEAWSQPHGERTVLTKPKIIPVDFKWMRVAWKRAPTPTHALRAERRGLRAPLTRCETALSLKP